MDGHIPVLMDALETRMECAMPSNGRKRWMECSRHGPCRARRGTKGDEEGAIVPAIDAGMETSEVEVSGVPTSRLTKVVHRAENA